MNLVAKSLASMNPPLIIIDGANLFRLSIDHQACCTHTRRCFERHYLMHGTRVLFWEGNLQCTVIIGTVELKYRCKEPRLVEELFKTISFDYHKRRTHVRFRIEAEDDGLVYPATIWLVDDRIRYPFVGPI